ncbi:hypothetical protein M3Y98_00810200 [Aphelenchoides besseyi]|nr:hypothetical protein M3Y98_00810200 [Aphelenchoides besseyi]
MPVWKLNINGQSNSRGVSKAHVFIFLIVISLAVTLNAETSSRLCGSKLTAMLQMVCKNNICGGYYMQTQKRTIRDLLTGQPGSFVPQEKRSYRAGGGIANVCCTRKCSLKYLRTYCCSSNDLTRNFFVLFLLHFSNHFVQSCSPPDFARYQDTTYVSGKCADLVLYPVNAVDQSDQYRFDYSDLASSSSGNAHSQGATVVITCSTTSNTQTVVEGYDQADSWPRVQTLAVLNTRGQFTEEFYIFNEPFQLSFFAGYFYMLLAITGILLNAYVIARLIQFALNDYERFKHGCGLPLAAMSISDLSSLVLIIFVVIVSGFLPQNLLSASAHSAHCKIIIYLIHTLTGFSTWCWLFISAVRYIAVYHPLWQVTTNALGPRTIVMVSLTMLLLNSWFPVVVVYVPETRKCEEQALSIGADWNRVLHGLELCWSYVIPAILTIALDIKVLLVRPPSFGRASHCSDTNTQRARTPSLGNELRAEKKCLQIPQKVKNLLCMNSQAMPKISILNEENQSCKDNSRTTSPNHLLTTIMHGRTLTNSTQRSTLLSDDISLAKYSAYQQNSWQSTCSRSGVIRSTRRSRQAVRRWLAITTIHLLLNAPDNILRLSSVIDPTPRHYSPTTYLIALVVRLLYFAQLCFNAIYLSAITYRRTIRPQKRQTTPKMSNVNLYINPEYSRPQTRVGIRDESRRQSRRHAELLRRYSADPRASREPNLRYHQHLQVNQPLNSVPLMPSYSSDTFRSENLDLARSISSLNSARSLSTEPRTEVNQTPLSAEISNDDSLNATDTPIMCSSIPSAQDEWSSKNERPNSLESARTLWSINRRMPSRMNSDDGDLHAPQTHSLFVGDKIAKIEFAGELQNNVDSYICGTWNGRTNRVSLWNTYHGRAKIEPKEYFYKVAEASVSGSVNDIFVYDKNVVVGLDNGDVGLFSTAGNELQQVRIFPNVHNHCGSTSIAIVDEEVISGSDNGSIIRMDLAATSKPTALAVGLTSVKCLSVCGDFEFATGHGSGQIHLWDVRQVNPAVQLGENPVYSKAVAPLNDAVTGLGSHPGQRNVLAFGTSSGSVAFIDIRQYKQPLPSLLKISQDPITRVKFHPSFADNCFAITDEFLLHLDVTAGKPDRYEPGAPIDEITGRSRANVWLTASSWNMLVLNTLIGESPKKLSTFDASPHSILSDNTHEMDHWRKSLSQWRSKLFPPLSRSSLLRHYLPTSGAVSHTLFSVHIFAPQITARLFPSYDLAISNTVLFNSHVGIGFYVFFRKHMIRLPMWDRVEYSVVLSVLFNFGSLMFAVLTKALLPKRFVPSVNALIGAALSTFILTRGTKYMRQVDSRTVIPLTHRANGFTTPPRKSPPNLQTVPEDDGPSLANGVLLHTVYSIKRVVDGPKFVDENGKQVTYYKVRWVDTYEPAQNLPKREIDLYRATKKRRAKVLGPVASGENKFQDMQFAIELDSIVQLVPYKKLRTEYKDELIEFFEKKARPVTDLEQT